MKANIKRSAALLAAAAILAGGTALPAPAGLAKAADVLKYEFEDGKNSENKFYTEGWKDNTAKDGSGVDYDLTNFSGTGFSYLGDKNNTVSVEVDVPEEGLYRMIVGYCEPGDLRKKVQYLNINGVNQGEVTFPFNTSFGETNAGLVYLSAGKNTIEFKAYWGYTYFDYLTLTPADKKLQELAPDRTLCDPKASEQAQRLYSYLCDQYGTHIIAGQQEYCNSHNWNINSDPDPVYIKDNEAEFEYILDKTGKQPAIRGIDFLAYNSTTEWRDQATERVIEWSKRFKGIATATWHWNVPLEEGSTDTAFYVESANPKFTTFSVTNAVTEGTWEHEVVMADIAVIAAELKKIQDADVAFIWRPLHEAEGGWFWWGAEGPEPCKKLYRLLYDQLTNVYGIHNLIWEWTGYTSEASADWYPGDDVVDIIGYDKYNAADGKPNLSSISSTFYSLVDGTGGKKMVAMSENDSIPSLENLVNDHAAWLYFCPWYQNYLTSEQNNPVEELDKIYNSEYCITLDELPDLSTYPISTEPKATDPATTAPDSKTSWGDATCDGKVDLNDAVAILQYVALPKKYPLTELGEINADVFDNGSGITGKDALVIQMIDAKLLTVDALPVSELPAQTKEET